MFHYKNRGEVPTEISYLQVKLGMVNLIPDTYRTTKIAEVSQNSHSSQSSLTGSLPCFHSDDDFDFDLVALRQNVRIPVFKKCKQNC